LDVSGRSRPVGIGTGADLVDDLDVVVEDGRNDRNHISLNNASAHGFRAAHADVDNALKGQTPFPHLHQVLTPALLQDAYQSLDAAIDGQDVSNSRGRRGQVCEVVERVY
jgi:hypothetical protein